MCNLMVISWTSHDIIHNSFKLPPFWRFQFEYIMILYVQTIPLYPMLTFLWPLSSLRSNHNDDGSTAVENNFVSFLKAVQVGDICVIKLTLYWGISNKNIIRIFYLGINKIFFGFNKLFFTQHNPIARNLTREKLAST